MLELSRLDRFISFFSPRAAIKRAQARAALQAVGSRRYEAAARGRRTASWGAAGTDPNTALQGSLVTLRNRSRDLVRNDGYASKAVQVIVENTVGTGIVAKPSARSTGKVRDAADAWALWAESTACDVDGAHDFYGLQALVMRAVVESGECIVRRVKTAGGQIPLKIQVLEADYLDHLKNETLTGGGYIVQGVEFDAAGERVAYWLFDSHPGAGLILGKSFTSKRFPASEILHLYRVDRPGQVRGVPWGAPVMLALKDFNEYEDAQLVRQKVAGCFSLFVYDAETPIDPASNSQPPIDKIEPGLIEILPPGKRVEFANPPGVDGYSDYARQMLHKISAGFGVPYTSLTGDLSQVNFSSGRMGWLEFQRNIEAWRWRVLIPRLCDPVWAWFTEAAFLAGWGIVGVAPRWTPPRREMIDPASELRAQVTAIRSGVMTLSEAIRSNGFDPIEVLSERAEDDALLDKLGITLDSDPRRVSQSGGVQGQPAEAQMDAAQAQGGS